MYHQTHYKVNAFSVNDEKFVLFQLTCTVSFKTLCVSMTNLAENENISHTVWKLLSAHTQFLLVCDCLYSGTLYFNLTFDFHLHLSEKAV